MAHSPLFMGEVVRHEGQGASRLVPCHSVCWAEAVKNMNEDERGLSEQHGNIGPIVLLYIVGGRQAGVF